MERDISVRPTEITRLVELDHLQSWPEYSRTSKWSVPFDVPTQIPGIWVQWKVLQDSLGLYSGLIVVVIVVMLMFYVQWDVIPD